MSQFREQIKEKLPLSELIGRVVQLKRSGAEFVGCCPFHNEKTGSFFVNDDKGVYFCFGCRASGDHIRFLMDYEGVSFPVAQQELSTLAGISVPSQRLSKKSSAAEPDKPRTKLGDPRRQEQLQILKKAAEYFFKNLHRLEDGEAARQYLQQRGITSSTAREFGVGYAQDSFHDLERFLTTAFKEKKPEEIAKLGIITPRRDGKGFVDVFRDRIMFPVRDQAGNVLGFGGRLLKTKKEEAHHQPKYLNSKDGPLFKKNETLYGLDLAKQAIEENGQVIMVEGFFDVLSLHQAGFKQAVATLGTAISSQQISLLKRHTENVILLLDPDAAGQSATEAALPLMQKEGIICRAGRLPEGFDPSEFVLKKGAKELKKLLDEAVDLLDLFIDDKIGNFGKSYQERIRAAELITPLILSSPGGKTSKAWRLRNLQAKLDLAREDMPVGKSKGNKASKLARASVRPQRSKNYRDDWLGSQILRVFAHYPEMASSLPEEKKGLFHLISEPECRKLCEFAVSSQSLSGIPLDKIQSADHRSILARARIQSEGETPTESSDPIMDKTQASQLLSDAMLKLEIRDLEVKRDNLKKDFIAHPDNQDILEQKASISKKIKILRDQFVHMPSSESY